MIKKIPKVVGRAQANSSQTSVDALVQKAFAFHQKGDLMSAATIYFEVLKLDPDNFDALHLLGLVAGQNKDHASSIEYFSRAITVKPNDAAVYSNLGLTLHDLGKNDEALVCLNKSLELKKDNEEALYNKAVITAAIGMLREAVELYDVVVKKNPLNFKAHNNRGNALQRLKRFDEAIVAYDNAIRLNPNFPEPFNNRGNIYNLRKEPLKAVNDFQQAISIRSDYAEAFSNLGNSYHDLKRYEDALLRYNKAIELDQNYAEPYHNRGNLLTELQRFDESLPNFEMALKLKPEYEYVLGALIGNKLHLCNWSQLEDLRKGLIGQIEEGKKASPPFQIFPLLDSGGLQKKAALLWTQDKHPQENALPPPKFSYSGKKIKLGYFSADFHNHATSYLMAQLFELHDKEKFELFAFSFGPDIQDQMRARLVKAFDHFLDVRDMSDLEVAQLARAHEIHIAMDLKGYTQHGRTGIFSYRAAPVQINYLGYPGTMGAPYIDYLIADQTLIPEGKEDLYCEKILYMPHSYQVNDSLRKISDKNLSRADLGLPEDAFVFCCFNNNYKILPEMFDVWARILQQVPNSVLWLLEDNATARKNLMKEAAARNLDVERLVFAKRLPLAEHLARHRQADLFIDTYPCNAHTTASDALWAGLPVLTYAGDTFVSRVAASLLNAVGLPELITQSIEAYEARAIDLAINRPKLHKLQSTLAHNITHSPLYDTVQYAADLESLLINVLEREGFQI